MNFSGAEKERGTRNWQKAGEKSGRIRIAKIELSMMWRRRWGCRRDRFEDFIRSGVRYAQFAWNKKELFIHPKYNKRREWIINFPLLLMRWERGGKFSDASNDASLMLSLFQRMIRGEERGCQGWDEWTQDEEREKQRQKRAVRLHFIPAHLNSYTSHLISWCSPSRISFICYGGERILVFPSSSSLLVFLFSVSHLLISLHHISLSLSVILCPIHGSFMEFVYLFPSLSLICSQINERQGEWEATETTTDWWQRREDELLEMCKRDVTKW